MIIEDDVRAIARHFGLDPALIQAVVQAEGNIVRAVQCSYSNVTTRQEALEITCRSAAHAMSDYLKSDAARREAFVDFWGARWAPVGASNDPHHLNANWSGNVLYTWRKLEP